MQLQQTLKKTYTFEGKGLHTGKMARMTLNPAPADTGIRFRRIDLGENAYVDALADNVSSTARSTTISCGKASVTTIEHVLSALTGMGVDNALIDIDNVEVPILDGSAKPYIDTIWPDGFDQQDAPRKYIEIKAVTDERVCDGYYYASAFKLVKRYAENPELLEIKPEQVLEDID